MGIEFLHTRGGHEVRSERKSSNRKMSKQRDKDQMVIGFKISKREEQRGRRKRDRQKIVSDKARR